MDLIIFLILLVIYCSLKVKDDVALVRYDARYRQESARFDAWKKLVTNWNLERELKLFMERPENRDKLLDEVAEAYDSILEGKRLDEVYPRSYWTKPKKGWTPEYHEKVQNYVCRYNRENAMRIMLAKRGYIPTDDTFYSNKPTGFLITPHPLDRYVLFWCDEKLREKGAPLSLGHRETGGLIWKMK